MKKNKSKLQIVLRYFLFILFVLFILSISSLLYFRLYYKDDILHSDFISFLAQTSRSDMGFLYYVLIPVIVLLALLLCAFIVNERQKVKNEALIKKEDIPDIKMRKTPFMKNVYSNYDELKEDTNNNNYHDIVTETLKSPIVSKSKDYNKNIDSINVNKVVKLDNDIDKVETSKTFTPKYMLIDDISSISELKAEIKKQKLPKVCICSDGDLSSLTENEINQIRKINSMDSNKILKDIDKKNTEYFSKVKPKKIISHHTYKIKSKTKKYKHDKNIEKEKQKPKFLSADEIIDNYRKSKNSKNISIDIKNLDNMAKFYYESDIEEYKVK